MNLDLKLDLDERVIDALDDAADQYEVSREKLFEILLAGVTEGLQRPGSWERAHVEALLLGPLERARPAEE